MLEITSNIALKESELIFTFIRSPGPGGQHVNKTATAVLLRFNLKNSSLPQEVKTRAFLLFGTKITAAGDILIESSTHRSQEQNKQEAIKRLARLLRKAAVRRKVRKQTQPTKASKERRLEQKRVRAKHKQLRKQVFE